MKILNGILIIFGISFLGTGIFLKKRQGGIKSKKLLFIKNHLLIWVLIIITNGVGLLMSFSSMSSSDSILIEKEGIGGQEKNIVLKLSKDDMEEEIDYSVSPRQYTNEQAMEKMEEAFIYLNENIKGENLSLNHITKNLDFSMDESKYPFDVEFIPDIYALITSDGVVKNDSKYLKSLGYKKEEIERGIPVTIKVIIYYGRLQTENSISVLVFEGEMTEREKIFSGVKNKLDKVQKDALYEETLVLPSDIDGTKIERVDDKNVEPIHITIFGFILSGLLLVKEVEDKKERERKRIDHLRRSYPWFVNEMVLLLGAGMQVKNIFKTLIHEYDNQKGKGYQAELIEELQAACNGLEVGMSEEQVYYRLGRKIGLPCYIRLMTLLEQNIKKGSKGIIEIIEQEEQNALEERKTMAKRYGEEAGTKLLGPMILLLIIIMLIIMIPAFMSFQ